jgi:hypothetical protein
MSRIRRSRSRRRRQARARLAHARTPEQTLNVVLLAARLRSSISATLLGVLLERLAAGSWSLGIVLEYRRSSCREVAPEDVACSTPTGRAAHVRVPWFVTDFPPLRVSARGFIGSANVVLPGQGLKQGRSSPRKRSARWPTSPREEAAIETRGARAHPLDLRVRRHGRARGDGAAPDMVAVEPTRPSTRRSRGDQRGQVAAARVRRRTDNIVGLVFLKDLVTRSGSGEGNEPVRQMLRKVALRARVRSAWPSCCVRCRPRSSTWRS